MTYDDFYHPVTARQHQHRQQQLYKVCVQLFIQIELIQNMCEQTIAAEQISFCCREFSVSRRTGCHLRDTVHLTQALSGQWALWMVSSPKCHMEVALTKDPWGPGRELAKCHMMGSAVLASQGTTKKNQHPCCTSGTEQSRCTSNLCSLLSCS